MMVSTLAYTEQMRPKGQNPAVQQTAHYQYMRFSVTAFGDHFITGISWRMRRILRTLSEKKNDVAAGRSVAS